MPWLQVNLLTAFLAAAVVGLFEGTIAKFTALAILLPVVAGQSGNAGAQALAVTMRGLALHEIRLADWLQMARKEANVGIWNGIFHCHRLRCWCLCLERAVWTGTGDLFVHDHCNDTGRTRWSLGTDGIEKITTRPCGGFFDSTDDSHRYCWVFLISRNRDLTNGNTGLTSIQIMNMMH